jgi:hypothetical protein
MGKVGGAVSNLRLGLCLDGDGPRATGRHVEVVVAFDAMLGPERYAVPPASGRNSPPQELSSTPPTCSSNDPRIAA